jgi:hypothetical protein
VGSAWRAWVYPGISLVCSEDDPVRMLPAYGEHAKLKSQYPSGYSTGQSISVIPPIVFFYAEVHHPGMIA